MFKEHRELREVDAVGLRFEPDATAAEVRAQLLTRANRVLLEAVFEVEDAW